MNILQDVSLKLHSTMRLGGTAAYAVDIHSKEELTEALAWAEARNLPVMMIGIGSNIVWQDDGFPGLLLVNKITGITMQDENDDHTLVTIGAGENWDQAVAAAVERGLSGIEALSLIPGTAGATPVQNVGAYGQEIAHTLIDVEAYDAEAKQFVAIPASECAFGYRASRFKFADKGRFFITGITLRLSKATPQPPFYAALQKYLDEHEVHVYTPAVIRDAVIAIRSSKLPDPAKVANNGSFFANPIIDKHAFARLQADYPDMPSWPASGDKVKIPAAWLVEQTGFKGVHDAETGMSTWPVHALVLVNENAQTTGHLLAFKQKIVSAVQHKFGITLEQEPELLP
jgi:UDP-N-acetylmuramate dehydrogenase